jgi:hypothetical protein
MSGLSADALYVRIKNLGFKLKRLLIVKVCLPGKHSSMQDWAKGCRCLGRGTLSNSKFLSSGKAKVRQKDAGALAEVPCLI